MQSSVAVHLALVSLQLLVNSPRPLHQFVFIVLALFVACLLLACGGDLLPHGCLFGLEPIN